MENECRCVLCHDYGDRTDMVPGMRRLVHNVESRGWGVLAVPESDTEGSLAYTVGLWHTHRTPELALFGLDPQDMMAVLNLVGDRIAEGERFPVDSSLADILTGGYRLRTAAVDPAWHTAFFGIAFRFYRRTPHWPVLQCLWPDRDHRHPGDDGFDPLSRGRQPLLWLTPDRHPDDSWKARVPPDA